MGKTQSPSWRKLRGSDEVKISFVFVLNLRKQTDSLSLHYRSDTDSLDCRLYLSFGDVSLTQNHMFGLHLLYK